MRIYTKAGNLAFRTFSFPDQQPHFILETYEREFNVVTIETALKSPLELFSLILANDVLRQHGYSEVNLDIRYLLGARMDRAIDSMQPYTLQVVARILNGCGFSKVRILDVHSEVATRLIRNSTNVLPHNVVNQVLTSLGESAVVISPDEGAKARVQKLMSKHGDWEFGYASKQRDVATGALSSFYYGGPCKVQNKSCLIIDDICDGGGTFTGLAKVLRDKGATKVNLFVTHGIFSKGLPLEGIDHIYTTDSYIDKISGPYGEDRYHKIHALACTTVIPISMKEL